MTSNRILLQHRADKNVQLEIVFRQLTDPVPTGWKAGYHWQVEAYQRGLEQPPVAIGWVLDVGSAEYEPDLECVRVFRDYEDEDIAHAVTEAARLRWPNLRVQEGTSAEGNKWIEAFKNLKHFNWAVAQQTRS